MDRLNISTTPELRRRWDALAEIEKMDYEVVAPLYEPLRRRILGNVGQEFDRPSLYRLDRGHEEYQQQIVIICAAGDPPDVSAARRVIEAHAEWLRNFKAVLPMTAHEIAAREQQLDWAGEADTTTPDRIWAELVALKITLRLDAEGFLMAIPPLRNPRLLYLVRQHADGLKAIVRRETAGERIA